MSSQRLRTSRAQTAWNARGLELRQPTLALGGFEVTGTVAVRLTAAACSYRPRSKDEDRGGGQHRADYLELFTTSDSSGQYRLGSKLFDDAHQGFQVDWLDEVAVKSPRKRPIAVAWLPETRDCHEPERYSRFIEGS